jgi:ribosome maturation factor RimP
MMTVMDAELEQEIAAIATGVGCELLAIEFQDGTLQVILDNTEEGVTLEHCRKVSREASALLDAHDFGNKRYVLEVTSPGLDRRLYRPKDYQRFHGHLARVTFFSETEHSKKTIVGQLDDFNEQDGGQITVVESDTGEAIQIPLNAVKMARLEVELHQELHSSSN